MGKENKILGNFRGKVLSVTDPDKKGRIKVEIYPFFLGVQAKFLPWAVPCRPMFCGAGDGTGSFAIPAVNSYVWCFFEAGDKYQPVYFGEAPDFVHGIVQEAIANYPNVRAWKTPSGIVIQIDDSEPSITITHPEGVSIEIDSAGALTVSSEGIITISGQEVNINTEI